MRTVIVIPSLGSPHLQACLESVAALDPPPARVVVVLSGGAEAPLDRFEAKLVCRSRRLGFAAAVNLGLQSLECSTEAVALLNDDARPVRGWLGGLTARLARDSSLAAVQGTVVDASGATIDGRGIAFDRYGLPLQIDHGAPVDESAAEPELIAVSGTACVYRLEALRAAALHQGVFLDPRFGSYHEDLDLGLRLQRLGWRSCWVPYVPAAHRGSATGSGFPWRHPSWVLANRWRAIAGNLAPAAFLRAAPRLLRGEVRALNTLRRQNPRALGAAAGVALRWPLLVAGGWMRPSPGPRLRALPGVPA